MEDRIIRVLQGRARAADISALRGWRNESPDNESLYQELSAIWAALEEVDVETTAPPPSAIRAMAETSGPASTGSRQPHRRPWGAPLAIAASIALLMVVGELTRRQLPLDSDALQVTQLATGPSETLMTELSDGTTVYVGPNSTLKVLPRRGSREVWLEGRAFFGVAKDRRERPFAVRSTRGTAYVLGTRFEFSSDDEEVRVVVVDGKVRFDAAGEAVDIIAGQLGFARSDAAPILVEGANVDDILGWMGRSLVFEETPLSRAAGEIERRFSAVVEIRSADLARQTISGGFKDRTFSEVVTIICRAVSAECSIQNDHAVVSPRWDEGASTPRLPPGRDE